MKSLLIAAVALCQAMAPAYSANVSGAGTDGSDGGLLKIDQTDAYWWFCVQPDGSRGPLAAGTPGYTADIVSLDYGWTHQTTQRFAFASGAPAQVQADLGLHVNVIEYLLDSYLPWIETTDRYLEKSGLTDQSSDDNFLNRFYAVHAYVKELYLKSYADTDPEGSGFTDLSVFDPENPYTSLTPTSAEIARRDFFNDIKAEVRGKDRMNAFAGYNPLHTYAMVNTFQIQGNALDWQDAIIIVAKVPEPSIGLLAIGSVIALLARRCRA